MMVEIPMQKGLKGEQLIGITCGSASVIFTVLYIIITIYKKRNMKLLKGT